MYLWSLALLCSFDGVERNLPRISINAAEDAKQADDGDEQDEADDDEMEVGDEGVPLVGVGIAYVGMSVFNMGLRYGLQDLGDSVVLWCLRYSISSSPSGLPSRLPSGPFRYQRLHLLLGSLPRGRCAQCDGANTEKLTKGEFKKRLVALSVASGAAFGVMLGVLRMERMGLGNMLLVCYVVAMLLTILCSETFVPCFGRRGRDDGRHHGAARAGDGPRFG